MGDFDFQCIKHKQNESLQSRYGNKCERLGGLGKTSRICAKYGIIHMRAFYGNFLKG